MAETRFGRAINQAIEMANPGGTVVLFAPTPPGKPSIDLNQALDQERLAQEICRHTEDRVEGMNSFVEKRPPVFKGK